MDIQELQNLNIKLIALDLDGTLTNDEKEISPMTFDMLMRAQKQGIRLVLASGRPPYGMRPLARQLHMDEYGGLLLCYNGGHIEDCSTGEVVYQITLSEDLLPEVYDFQQRSGMTLMTYHEDKIYTEHADDRYVAQSSRNNKMEIVAVNDFVHDTPRPLYKCLMVGDPSIVPEWEAKMSEYFEGRMNICHSTPYFIEVLPLGIDKGDALLSLLQKLNLTTENLITFGDSNNDVSMIKVAGCGVAMGNAEPQVQAIADLITDDNNSDGVGKIIDLLLGNV